MERKKIFLGEEEIPRQWYNILADIKMNPPLGPDGKPVSPEMLAPVFPMNLIEQEVSSQRWIDIPEEVLRIYRIWRPSPLVRAFALEKALDTPAHIYFKYEGTSPPGSHKPNTAVPQAYYNKVFGIKRLVTETGAGQWGSALAFACAQFGLECKVYMVRVSFDQKPYRKVMMQTWGANCVPSPSTETKAGRDILAEHPDSPGSLGIAISEAVEAAVSDGSGRTRYSLGSVLNHVMLHQTVIGLEAKKQMEIAGEYPDVVIGCAGGGSNFAGLAFPFVYDKIHGRQVAIHPVEPTACPTLTKAPYVYDHGDTAGYTPLLPMHSLGHTFMPPPVHAGGLRYHGMAPTVSQLVVEGLLEPRSYGQMATFEAGMLIARAEGIIPAPETNHAIACVVDEARRAKEEGKAKVILFNWSGHGLIDLGSYEKYLSGSLRDFDYPAREIEEAGKILAKYPKPQILKSR
ncbi:MAG: TrpB-like pyridoxal phosphate-dependent enzyme [Desulfobacterales bacterium]|nr:TrpB-like pyridoxal phosphate-dependent enzyme [Desulfobacterales bacterium]MCU0585405.1 TrpB-like pyridoxal phosphate-dependent enzyme [Desulfobacterales bacterium]